ncbi:unnamed protein product [Phyllotreta striolata]|uniref:Uncharacterized protein n=1 Tax=Phyllotreta striolata TaxID=444603 RepID=A0A9N9TNB3_PHYSR|nr:unnamed protein product [Phyllotreta striolata]
MVAGPGVPEDRDSALKLVEFMSIMLFFAVDQQLFGMVCDYSKKLVVSAKADPAVVSLFCCENKNILWAMKRLKTFSDEVAISLMDFVRTLLLVQVRNKCFVEDCMMIDFSCGLTGSTAKMMLCLDLLLVFTLPDLFIQISPNAVKTIFFQLFSLYRDKNLSVMSLVCMRRLMKRDPWLAALDTTHIFLETQCSLKVDENSCLEFIHCLYAWMKIFNRHSFGGKTLIEVQTDVIQSYVRRAVIALENKVNFCKIMWIIPKRSC